MSFPLPDLKRPPFNVVLLRWPQDGDEWIHPEDRRLAEGWLPSDRVFRCLGVEEGYNILAYGHRVLRIKPVLWQEVPDEGLQIGDQVEVLSQWGKNWPRVAFVREMRWSESQRVIHFYLRERHREIPTPYTAEDLRLIEHFDRSFGV